MAAWRSILEKLDLPPKEKGEILHELFRGKWGDQALDGFFQDCLDSRGQECLVAALQRWRKGEDVGVKKKVQIFSAEADDEDLLLRGLWYVLTPSSFQALVPNKGVLVPFKGREGMEDATAIMQFDDLVEGESYVLQDPGLIWGKLKSLDNFNRNEIKAGEEEFSRSMVAELEAHGMAKQPVIRNDLRILLPGTSQEQEFDAIVIDQEDKAFVGCAKHVVHGTWEVEKLIEQVQTLLHRSKNLANFPSCAPFAGRDVGCCMRVDYMKVANAEAVKHLCYRKGIALFERSGAALRLHRVRTFSEPQLINPGFLNLVLRGLKAVAR